LLTSPLVITAIFLTVGLFMPLMEELLKPLGLWVLRKRLLTPAEGFSGGLICGAGFALFESATMIAQTGGSADWGQMVLLRIATSLLHITASGFVGWGLASAWSQKKYGRTLLTILVAASVHGLWNTIAILIVLLPFITSSSTQTALLQVSSGVGTFTMASILILLAAALVVMNRRLRRETQTSQPGVITTPSI
jgi:RsiW-degrading membrane proteinase PrsW (M82 family)